MIMITENESWKTDYDIELWTDDELWRVYQYLPVSTIGIKYDLWYIYIYIYMYIHTYHIGIYWIYDHGIFG